MESRGSAVLGLGQLLAPFGEHQRQEEAAPVLPWRGGGGGGEVEEAAAAAAEGGGGGGGKAGGAVREAAEEAQEALLELRRRRGRSLSLPASPTLAAAQLFPRRRGEEEEEEEEEEEDDEAGGASVSGCCTKCKKRVQFADSLGLCLASVKHFSAAEEPQVPPAVLSRLQSFPMRQKDFEEFSAALAELSGCATVVPRSFLPSPPPPPPPQALQLVSRPEGPLVDAERLRRERVCLEEVEGTAVSGVPTDVRGVVRVLSCPGPKEVSVRYTFNEWRSFLDAAVTPLPPPDGGDPPNASSASSCSVERYHFSLCLPPGLEEGTAVHFAVCYRNQQGEYWDNNSGANYTLRSCRAAENPAPPQY